MGICVEKIECGECGGSNLQVFYDDVKDSYNGTCFGGCGGRYEPNPYKDVDPDRPKPTPPTPEELMEAVREVQACKVFTDPSGSYRGIPNDSFRSWGVRLLVSEYDGKTPYAVAFGHTNKGKLQSWKCSTLGKSKSQFSVGDAKSIDMFGWARAMKIGGKRLYITEGEYDAIALDHCLVQAQKDTKFARDGYPVVSVTNGAGGIVKSLERMSKEIRNNFKEVVLVFDNDEAGKLAEKKAQAYWPEILRADIPTGFKDANDALMGGQAWQMAQNAMWKAHKPAIQGVVRVSDVIERALKPAEMGLSYPMQALTEMTYGQRFGEAVCLGAGVGIGKTVTAHEFAAWNMTEHSTPVFMALLEEQNHDTVKNVAAKIDSVPYNNPHIEFNKEIFRDTCVGLQEKLFLWESEGDQHLRFEMDEILGAIRFNALEYGVKFAYIDNFTRLTDHLSPSDANEFINKYASEIENLSTQLDIHIMSYSHLNPVRDGGVSHEAGGDVYASQFTGSRGIMRSFPMLMSFRRNKHAKDEEGRDKNNSILGVIKNRKFGNEGEVRTQYDPKTGRLKATAWEGELKNEREGR